VNHGGDVVALAVALAPTAVAFAAAPGWVFAPFALDAFVEFVALAAAEPVVDSDAGPGFCEASTAKITV
jgi:hypothetical protein